MSEPTYEYRRAFRHSTTGTMRYVVMHPGELDLPWRSAPEWQQLGVERRLVGMWEPMESEKL